MHQEAREQERVSAKRRERAVFNALWRELIGAGARPATVRGRKEEFFGIVNLPLGGRLKTTGSKDPQHLADIWRELRERREKRRWGALVRPSWGRSQGPTVQIPMEDFCVLLGALDKLLREKARRDAEHEHMERNGGGRAGATVHPERAGGSELPHR